MTILSVSAAAAAAGIDRRTLQRAIKSGRLSATVDAAGERGIDVAELIRVFGPLRETPQGQGAAMSQDAPGDAAGAALVATLRDMVRQLEEQVRQAYEREQRTEEEKTRLLAMLETEQQARRELETKLLPAPIKPAPSNHRLWILLLLLLSALGLAIWHWRELIIPYF